MSDHDTPFDCWWISRAPELNTWQVQRLEFSSRGWLAQPAQAWAEFAGSAEHINSLTMASTVVLINLPNEPSPTRKAEHWCTVRQDPVRWHAVANTPALAGLYDTLQHYPARIQLVCEPNCSAGPDCTEYVLLQGEEHAMFEQWVQGLTHWPPLRWARLSFNVRQAMLSRRHVCLRLVLTALVAGGVLLGFTAQQTQRAPEPRTASATLTNPGADRHRPTPQVELSTPHWQAWAAQLHTFGARGKKHIESLEFEWKDGIPSLSLVTLDRIPRRLPKGCIDTQGVVTCTPQEPINPSGLQP